MKKIIIAALFIVCFIGICAAGFPVTSKVDSVLISSYYRIQLTPDVISFSRNDYSDIRLFNSHGKEIPYILKEEKPASAITGFKEYPLLENSYLENKNITRVIIHNREKSVLSEFVLVIRNSEIEKEFTLKGSDDKSNWYIIRKGILTSIEEFNETSKRVILNFPKSNYEYLELTINDKKKDPVQVIKVGCYDFQFEKGIYAGVPIKLVSQKDSSDRKSYITLEFLRNYEIDKLNFSITGPDLYRRHGYIGKYITYDGKKSFEVLDQFEIFSGKPTSWEIERTKAAELVLVIENSDNMPLTVKSAKAYQLNKYLIAKLNAGESYFVKSGNEKLSTPDYDLKYFSGSIPANLPVLHSKDSIVLISGNRSAKQVIFTKTVLWTIIVLVMGLLGFLSIRLVREIEKKQ